MFHIYKHPVVAVLVAAAFFVSGHFFLTAYNRYNVSAEKLSLLQKQKRAVKKQIRVLEQKKQVLNRVNRFLTQAEHQGWQTDQWDRFFVDLDKEAISFPALQALLDQTDHSHDYYFKPQRLSITGQDLASDVSRENVAPDLPLAISAANPGQAGGDVVISCQGYFLIRNRRPDG
jgi:hypothetical protein